MNNNQTIQQEIETIKTNAKSFVMALQSRPLLSKTILDDLCEYLRTIQFDGVDKEQFIRLLKAITEESEEMQQLITTISNDAILRKLMNQFVSNHHKCSYVLTRGDRVGQCCNKKTFINLSGENLMDNYVLVLLYFFKKYNKFVLELYIPAYCSSHNQPHHTGSASQHLLQKGKIIVKQIIQTLSKNESLTEKQKYWTDKYKLSDDFLNCLFINELFEK